MAETLSEHTMEVDPNTERSLKIRRTLNNAIRCNREMYEGEIYKFLPVDFASVLL